MKILYLHQYFATPDSNAGTRSFEMAKRFVAKGHSVTFVTSSAFLSKNYKLSSGWNELNIEGIKLYVLHLPYSNNDSYLNRVMKFILFSLRATFKAIKIKSDVVFATSTPLTIAIPGVISSKVNKTPMVFEVRDLWPEIPIAVGAIKNPILIWLSKKLEKFAYNNANRLVGLSPGMCEGIEKAGIHKEKITLATNSCDTGLFDVDRNVGIKYIKESLAFLNNRKLVVYTGTFGPINDVNYIVKLAEASMNRFPNICFVAVGSGMMKEGVIDLAKSRGVLNKNLYILDPMPKTEVVKLLSAAELSLSLFGDVKEMWHNSANKLFDALASQTPIAINYGGWQKDLIDNYQCGVVLHKLDYEGAAYAINDFLSDSNRYKKAKFSCKDLAYNHYSRDIMADRLEKALLEAIND
ncbi:glycosyltransferase family 4 protein [Vibrio parahaemolyticus]|uniref:Glycosyltransferase n=1 Tax=Vibrio parahaemolyticus TaxID=670 RepID=A0A5P1PNM0_VIBPH|nr:glycosyltransferase family 4 protein [Vibrio parahaemolyticus]EJG1708381.1 glycosyltransferase family 4 protein [Vibrio parahaemolyticus]EJG1744736.1 glycosyltransferase family 4 protein [Vibrio parahaemolyticus]EJG1779519.1 glycosyltransferase family 4 protein [Vibrio parahaemolyticus]EJH0828383.1 glycosyltransferase family 4 protein [Vibrio parahaemolyticus]EJK2108760.1 glycosyltransferase family 4 protein [Vibrio parahaemolyticus]